jgi:CHAT domain-containing protein
LQCLSVNAKTQRFKAATSIFCSFVHCSFVCSHEIAMAPEQLIETLLTLPDAAAQRRHLEACRIALDDQFAQTLKTCADHFLRADIQQSFRVAALLLLLAEMHQNPVYRALGLRAEGNAHAIGMGEYRQALDCYDQAAAIYESLGDTVEQARTEAGKLWSLANLGRAQEALTIGAWASDILQTHAQWRPLATLTMNLAIIHGRLGQDAEALALFDRAGAIYHDLGDEGIPFRPLIEQNRSIVLRNLGQFEQAIHAGHNAHQALLSLEQPVEAARAQQNLAITYFIQGRYTEALALLDQTREVFLADGRQRDMLLLDLFTGDCLLHLRRFADVLDKCSNARSLFSERGARFEAAQALLNEAAAYAGLQRYEQALTSLAEARRLFEAEGNQAWAATSDLEQASVLLRRGQRAASLALARNCADIFQMYGLSLKEAQAYLIAARAALALDQLEQARDFVMRSLAIGQQTSIPALIYQARHLMAVLLRSEGRLQAALAENEQALQELERMRNHVMIEFRAAFLEDKQAIYEDSVAVALELEQPLQGLDYVERARSRALLDMLKHRLDVSIHARRNSDAPLVAELNQLRAERDRLARRWESREVMLEEGPPSDEDRRQTQHELLTLEQQITTAWHQLLVRNADYARDASLWQIRSEPIQPHLEAGTALIEYFWVHGKLIAFLVTHDSVQVTQLPADRTRLQQTAQLLTLNLSAVPGSSSERVVTLERNACRLLRQLHEWLIAPFAAKLAAYPRLIIVPHGPLHYLPIHALYDGERFLLEQHEISYLPGGSLLRYVRGARKDSGGVLVMGSSYDGRLPHAVTEAHSVAAMLGEQAHVEEQASLEHLRAKTEQSRIIHLATHGDFRPDNPLFSGLALADGWLTTLDIFNLRLQASLVTLSACQTGRSVVGGGDELLGLMRALLYAGAASLVLSLWAVEDHSSAQLMQAFYQQLIAGASKAAALRQAQLQLRTDTGAERIYTHPYYWAPFFLVGDVGVL